MIKKFFQVSGLVSPLQILPTSPELVSSVQICFKSSNNIYKT
jgi:hypothetical protein